MAEKLYYADEKGRIFTGRDENNLFGARLFVDSTPDRSMGLWFTLDEFVAAWAAAQAKKAPPLP